MTDDLSDDRLRAAYGAHLRARATSASAAAPHAACPAPEALLALVRREGTEADRLAVLDHVMGCARCRREFDLLRALETAGQSQAAGGRGPATTTRQRPPRWIGAVGLALAASAVLAVGIARWDRGQGAESAASDVERGGATEVVLAAPASGSVPAGVPLRFVWHPVPRATRYDVEVLAPDGTVVVTATTRDTAIAADASRLTVGTSYQWWVRAVGDADAPRRSPLRTLRLVPR